MILSVEVQLPLKEGQWWVGEVVEELLMIGMVVHLPTHSKCSQEPFLTVVKPTALLINSVLQFEELK